MFESRIEKMAQVMIHYSTAVQAGETVFIRGLSPSAEPLIQALYQEVLRVGAIAVPYMHIGMESALAAQATDNLNLLAKPNPILIQMYQTADVVIGIHAAENMKELSNYPSEKQAALAQAKYAPIKIQNERQANKTIRRCTTQFPTQAYAQAAGMSLLQYRDFLFRACKVHLDDPIAAWQTLRKKQEGLIEFLRGKKHVQIQGDHIDLQLSTEGRKFINSAGTANFPDGEIFTGPVEDSVNGWVRFSYPAYYQGVEVKGIELRFEEGKVVQASADSNEAFLLKMLDSDPNARRLGEFGIGTNMDIQQFTGSMLFDEKIGGTIHLAIGQGYGETGSLNQSAIHWDMICDLRDKGEIVVDGELFYKDGKFIVG